MNSQPSCGGCRETDRKYSELEGEAANANKILQQAETTLSNFKSQLKAKREELKGLFFCYASHGSRSHAVYLPGYEKKLKVAVEDTDLEQAIKEATLELNIRKESVNLCHHDQLVTDLDASQG